MQQILHLLCTAGSCQLHFSGREHTLTAGCCMIAMASHVGNIRPSADGRLYQLLLPADQQAGCMPHSSYGTCGWLHLFMHPIFRLEGDMLAILEHDFQDVAFRTEHTPQAYRQEAVLQGMRTLYLDAMNALGGSDDSGVLKNRTERNLLFPIPAQELNTNQAINSNNPGWN